MKSLLMLWQKVAEESATRCCTCATMDLKTVHERVKHEGLSFLTITLSNFGKDFEKSLDQGFVDSRLFAGFRRKAGLPRFLGGFLCRVFDGNTGLLLLEPDIDAILAIRQLTLMFGKINVECSDARKRRALSGYLQCEQEVRRNDAELSPIDLERFRRVSNLLFGDVLHELDLAVWFREEIVPKHGPGSTADGLLGNQKYTQRTWPMRLNEFFPYWDFLIPNVRHVERLEDVALLEPGAEIPAKVITVPKTLKTPRIIAMEPTAMQYAQQALLPLIVDELARDDNLRFIIGIEDQTPNQELAREGSLHGDLATLDLSEASDRVSNQLVRALLDPHPQLHGAVDACRSRKVDVDGKTVRLAKFASMGSALCFPFEAMVFTTLIFMGIEEGLSSPLDARDVKRLRRQVRVYGDDIIVPVDHVHSVIGVLQNFGSVVNTGKSFWTGKFRESCGREYYDGHDVSIVRVRHMFPSSRKDATGVMSIVSLRNQLYFAGYWETCKWLDSIIEGVIRHFPVVLPSSPVLGRHSFLGFQTEKLHADLHSPLVRGYVSSARIPINMIDDVDALLKYHLKRGREPSFDVNHLTRSGRAQSIDIKLRWASAV